MGTRALWSRSVDKQCSYSLYMWVESNSDVITAHLWDYWDVDCELGKSERFKYGPRSIRPTEGYKKETRIRDDDRKTDRLTVISRMNLRWIHGSVVLCRVMREQSEPVPKFHGGKYNGLYSSWAVPCDLLEIIRSRRWMFSFLLSDHSATIIYNTTRRTTWLWTRL